MGNSKRKTQNAKLLLLLLLAVCGCGRAQGGGTGAEQSTTLVPTAYLPTVVRSADWWRPGPGLSWQWQLSGAPIDQSVDAQVYDIDYEADAETVAQLRAAGRRTICYINVGAWEEWRPDAAQFPPSVIGKEYTGWPGERWLDIRQVELLAPLMRQRMDVCKAKGFDAVEPDNMDAYQADTGFPLTAADQLAYVRWLAGEAHARGLSIGLKNSPELAADLLPDLDWALTESCFAQGWCEEMRPFLDAGKAVFAAEYTDSGMTTARFCEEARHLGISAILKHRDLDAYRETC
ncbi:MAG TPA: endo alpha-1,4 polygalactosaminidase [Roseiflexaceae bacterium]|nr:endo alpha-1,4 polygalactosaminidase [Roseiflexaceae bacterium]